MLQILLSIPPDRATLDYAENLVDLHHNPPKPNPGLTWQDILAEEPFEGEHWRGAYGMPPGSIAGHAVEDLSDSNSSPLSPMSDLDDRDDAVSSAGSSAASTGLTDLDELPSQFRTGRYTDDEVLHQSLRLREDLEDLHKRQYWKSDWRTDADVHVGFDLGNPSTLGPALSRQLHQNNLFSISRDDEVSHGSFRRGAKLTSN